MTWTRLAHQCALPDGTRIGAIGALKNSAWRCDSEGCTREWRLVEIRRTEGEDPYRYSYHWECMNHSTQDHTGQITKPCAVTR
jgi:hypothetical protein